MDTGGSALHMGEKQGCLSMRRGEALLPLLPVGLRMEGLGFGCRGGNPREDSSSEQSAGQGARRAPVVPAFIWAFSATGLGPAAPLRSGPPRRVVLQGR